MRCALLFILTACAGAGKDSGRIHYSDCDDSCEETDSDTDDTGTATPGLEVCDDGVDNDGNGEVDEVGCIRAWVVGTYPTQAFGGYLVAAANDSALWAYGADGEENADTVGGLTLNNEAPALSSLWSTAGGAGDWPLVAVASVSEANFAVYSTPNLNNSDQLNLARIPRAGGAPSETEAFASFAVQSDGEIADLGCLDVLGGSVLNVAAGTSAENVYVAYGLSLDAEAGQLADHTDAVFSLADDPAGWHLFGRAVTFLPDNGGDGIADLAIGAPGAGNYTVGSAVYIFDGTLRGDLDAADADAVIGDSSATGYGERIKRLGDLDGDGYDDLAVTYSYLGVDIWFGPFQGAMDADDMYESGALAVAGEGSADGDDSPDLALAGNDGAVHLFSGPVQRGSLDSEDANYIIPTPAIEWSIRSQLLFADADGNGTNELIVGHPDYGRAGTDPGPGLIAVFDLSDW